MPQAPPALSDLLDHVEMLRNLRCWKNTFWMLEKIQLSMLRKPGCWKNTFSMLEKFLMLEKHLLKAGKTPSLLFCNGEKRGIWSQCWITLCGAFGRVFAPAHGGLWRRVTFHRSSRKEGVNCVWRRRWGGRRCCWGGWLTLWWAGAHANGSWAVRRRSTTTSSIRNTRGRWRSIAHGSRSE